MTKPEDQVRVEPQRELGVAQWFGRCCNAQVRGRFTSVDTLYQSYRAEAADRGLAACDRMMFCSRLSMLRQGPDSARLHRQGTSTGGVFYQVELTGPGDQPAAISLERSHDRPHGAEFEPVTGDWHGVAKSILTPVVSCDDPKAEPRLHVEPDGTPEAVSAPDVLLTPRRVTLELAMQAVTVDRAATHGDVEDSFAEIAGLWSAYLGMEITPVTVVHMMILLKVARSACNASHQDNWTDIAGYAACGAEVVGL